MKTIKFKPRKFSINEKWKKRFIERVEKRLDKKGIAVIENLPSHISMREVYINTTQLYNVQILDKTYVILTRGSNEKALAGHQKAS